MKLCEHQSRRNGHTYCTIHTNALQSEKSAVSVVTDVLRRFGGRLSRR